MPSASSNLLAETKYSFGRFELYVRQHILLRDGVPTRIGGRALELLTILVERAGETIEKEELIRRAWPGVFVHENNLKVNIAGVRRVLDSDGTRSMIATIAGRGYRFVAPVRREVAVAEAISAARGGLDLPPRIPLFGRAPDLALISELQATSAVVTVVGEGGIGKTAVAIAAAHAAARACANGAAFIDLARIGDPQFLPAAIAFALGLGMTGADPLASVIHALRLQQKVLLIDNCEHLLPATAAAVDRLAAQLGGVRILATSREPLRIRDERVYRLGSLEWDPSVRPTASEARQFPAVELFVTRAFERTEHELTDADAPAVAEICRRLDGNALAIELAARQTAAFPAERIRDMLDDRFRLLQFGPPGAPLRQQTLLATLDWSYALLSEGEASVLRAISVFASALDFDGAVAVSGVARAEVLEVLGQLATKSLLVAGLDAGVVTYRLLETTRAYCLERLRTSGEGPAVRQRHAEHVCEVLQRAASEWAVRPAREWGAVYGPVLDDLRAALAWARQDPGNRALLIRLTVAGGILWNHFSQLDECRDHVLRALVDLDAAGLAGTAAEMKLQTLLGGATMFTCGPAPAALEAAERALEVASRIGDIDYRLRNLWSIAVQKMVAGEHDDAIARLETFASLASSHDPSALPDGERLMARVEFHVGRLQTCRQRLDRLFEQSQQPAETGRLARFQFDRNVAIGSVLANAQWLMGSPDTAAHTAAATVEQGMATGHELSLISCLAFTACPVALWSGRHEDAGRYLAMLEDHLSRHGVEIWRSVALYFRGVLTCASDGISNGGIDLLKEAIEGCDAARLRKRLPHFMGTLAEALVVRERVDEAAATLQAAIERAEAHNEQWCIPELLRINAMIAHAGGQPDKAERLLIESMTVADVLGALSWRLRAANDLARLWQARSRTDDARRMLLPIFRAFTEGFDTRDLVAAAQLLGALQPRDLRAESRPASRLVRAQRG